MENFVIYPADYILQKNSKSVKAMKHYLHENYPLKVKAFIVNLPNTYTISNNFEHSDWCHSRKNGAHLLDTSILGVYAQHNSS